MKKLLVVSTLLVAAGATFAVGVRGAATPVSPLAGGTILDPFRLQVVTATLTPLQGDGGMTLDGEFAPNGVRPGPFTPPPRSPYAPPPR